VTARPSRGVDDAGGTTPRRHHRVLVVGGGNGGLSLAGRLRRAGIDDIAVVEPRSHHLYQPLFSHIAGGTARAGQARRPQDEVIPRGVTWIHDSATGVRPSEHAVELGSGALVTYEQLVLAPGIRRDWARVPGLEEAIGTPTVTSHYEYDLAQKTSRLLRDLRAGTVVFTQPDGPASCAGAAQKPMYLACDYWRRIGVLDDIRVVLVLPTPTMFGIPLIDDELARKTAEYGIEVRFSSELAAVDAASSSVTIRSADGVDEQLHYDVLNVVPVQRAPEWIAASGLSAPHDESDQVDVDPRRLQHRHHPDIWALGDAASAAGSKSGGALRRQTKVVAQNVLAVLDGRDPSAVYDGYSVAPFTVSRGTVVFAEFDDRLRPKPTIPFWTGLARERRLTWLFDRHILPWIYWHLITQGRA